MGKGFFITFEGSEGCGKSTNIAELVRYLQSRGRECVLTREPGGTPLSEKIRELLLTAREGDGMSARTEILLFEASRAEHVEKLIKPALAQGKVVICDRFADSTCAYQGVARAIDPDTVDLLNAFAMGGAVPDLTVVLDIDPKVGLERARRRDSGRADRMGSEKIEFYAKVREGFLKLAEKYPERIAVVDSSGDRERTFAQIVKAVEGRLP